MNKTMKKMNEDEIFSMREEIERKFEEHLKKGEDMRQYLYYPHSVLSDRIREFLDEFLMLEAFKCISSDKFNAEKFVVYKDPVITVNLDKKDQKIDLLERMISYFIIKEEYEKCSIIQKLLNKVK